jgi:hypothetical protein
MHRDLCILFWNGGSRLLTTTPSTVLGLHTYILHDASVLLSDATLN